MIPRYLPLSSYQKRREKLFRRLTPETDLVIFYNAPERVRNHDSEYPYRADSSFYYLTGFPEPQSAFMMWKEKSGQKHFVMFTMERDPKMEQWTGRRYGPRGAKTQFGATDSDVSTEIEHHFRKFLETRTKGSYVRVLTNAFFDHDLRDRFLQMIDSSRGDIRRVGSQVVDIRDVGPAVQRMRVVKDAQEIKTMREASKIAVEGHKHALDVLKPGMFEYELHGAIEGAYQKRGALEPSYNSIVASGENATILHYNANNRKMNKGDLVLIDSGCEYQFYAADITRTFPVGGEFTKAQRNIMDIVGEAHSECIRVSRAGVPYTKIHDTACRVLVEGLKSLKFLKGSTKDILKKGSFRQYYPHGTGHWLGLDVHDQCPYSDEKGQALKLRSGHVFTVEPGLYFPKNDKSVPKEYRGIGVRIEDDVLVKPKGSGEILTKGLPRYAQEIEDYMKNR